MKGTRIFTLGWLVVAISSAALAQSTDVSRVIDQALNAALQPLNAWRGCLFKFASGAAPANPEPAAAIATAALAACLTFENEAFVALSSFRPPAASSVEAATWKKFVGDDLWPTMRKNLEDQTTAAAMAARAAR